MGRVMLCNTHFANMKKRLREAQVKALAKKVQLTEAQLHQDLTNKQVKKILSESQGKLIDLFQDLVVCNNHVLSAKWYMYGDTCSKTFFDFHLIGKKKHSSKSWRQREF